MLVFSACPSAPLATPTGYTEASAAPVSLLKTSLLLLAVIPAQVSALFTSGLASWPSAVKMSVRVTMPTSFAEASTMGMRCTCVHVSSVKDLG